MCWRSMPGFVPTTPVSLSSRSARPRVPERPTHHRRLQSLEASLAAVPPIEIDESQAFQAAKRDLEAELRGW
jgi:hypothetical protein